MQTNEKCRVRIMVFLHGTTIMHRGGLGRTRAERVKQVANGEDSVEDLWRYVPIGNAVEKLRTWEAQGASIVYLSSHQVASAVEADRAVLKRHSFPTGRVLYREPHGTYQGIVEEVVPDVLIEDDCESIGGESEMVYPQLRPELKAKITSITVPEFAGIDHLPDDIHAL
jgi:hypothetical protein